MGMWLLVGAILIAAVGYTAWEVRWYWGTLVQTWRNDRGARDGHHAPPGGFDAGSHRLERAAGGYDVVDYQHTSPAADREAAPQHPPVGRSPLCIDRLDTELAGDLEGKDDPAGCGPGHKLYLAVPKTGSDQSGQGRRCHRVLEDAELLQVIRPVSPTRIAEMALQHGARSLEGLDRQLLRHGPPS